MYKQNVVSPIHWNIIRPYKGVKYWYTATWLNAENMMLSEGSQVQKTIILYNSIYMKFPGKSIEIKSRLVGTSLLAQWLSIHLPVQGTQAPSLVRDSTWLGATRPAHHNYWSLCALGPMSCNYWACGPQLLKPMHPRVHEPQVPSPLLQLPKLVSSESVLCNEEQHLLATTRKTPSTAMKIQQPKTNEYCFIYFLGRLVVAKSWG